MWAPGVTALAPGDCVFCSPSAPDRLYRARDLAMRLPAALDPVLGVFAANLETAVNVLLDTPLKLGETAVVFGQGTVGLLIAQLAAAGRGRQRDCRRSAARPAGAGAAPRRRPGARAGPRAAGAHPRAERGAGRRRGYRSQRRLPRPPGGHRLRRRRRHGRRGLLVRHQARDARAGRAFSSWAGPRALLAGGPARPGTRAALGSRPAPGRRPRSAARPSPGRPDHPQRSPSPPRPAPTTS